jgi:hypothetical protein
VRYSSLRYFVHEFHYTVYAINILIKIIWPKIIKLFPFGSLTSTLFVMYSNMRLLYCFCWFSEEELASHLVGTSIRGVLHHLLWLPRDAAWPTPGVCVWSWSHFCIKHTFKINSTSDTSPYVIILPCLSMSWAHPSYPSRNPGLGQWLGHALWKVRRFCQTYT